MRRLAPFALVVSVFAGPAAAQAGKPATAPSPAAASAAATDADPRFAGHWAGTFKAGNLDLDLVLHIAPADSGGFAVTYDFPSQGASGVTTAATLAGTRISLRPQAGVSYEGTLAAAGDAIAGKLSTPDGSEVNLNFARTAAPPPPAAEVADPEGRTGDYAGAIAMGAMSFDITLHLRRTAEGYVATLDVPTQEAAGLRATSATVEGEQLTVVFPFPGEPTFTGRFAGDGLDGTWTQGGREIPLVLARVAAD